ncbi:hypothetical protein CWATWH8502_1726 [Crocosphaera watsonii WH 8502]|uniref:Uncharacterized protein n=1 Tax=Crocosphaera watsonii WH 8502 TaxID=423474 RepID=T2IAH4_CROWT|nr:hypothetical protein CWATWH8502_1726 [Crocosphaera watsonii WH 8502]
MEKDGTIKMSVPFRSVVWALALFGLKAQKTLKGLLRT